MDIKIRVEYSEKEKSSCEIPKFIFSVNEFMGYYYG
jgi:hypothetical protein